MAIKAPKHTIEQINRVRKEGFVNMFDINEVLQRLTVYKDQPSVEWLRNNRDLYARSIFEGFIAEA